MDTSNLNHTLDDAAGKAQRQQGLLVQSFAASLTVSAGILAFAIVVFVLLKDRRPRI
jgi:hypothetical protein